VIPQANQSSFGLFATTKMLSSPAALSYVTPVRLQKPNRTSKRGHGHVAPRRIDPVSRLRSEREHVRRVRPQVQFVWRCLYAADFPEFCLRAPRFFFSVPSMPISSRGWGHARFGFETLLIRGLFFTSFWLLPTIIPIRKPTRPTIFLKLRFSEASESAMAALYLFIHSCSGSDTPL
jgi:hypothetical protein